MILKATTELISLPPQVIPFAEVIAHSSGSAAGFFVNSEWLTCPEKSRLRAIGVRRKGWARKGEEDTELSALDFGTLIHEVLRFRVWHGHEAAVQLLEIWRPEIGGSFVKAALLLGMYEQKFPHAYEPLKFIGVESEVVTNIRMGVNDARPCYRSVRYDGIVLASGGPGTQPEVYSLERKTSARSGGFQAYYGQGMVQMGIWNSNAELVAQHGPMRGVIYEQLVKTKMPSVDREPVYFSPEQQRLAMEYMRYSENGTVVFRPLPDGTYPKMLHSCWGRYSPCDYISACHEGVTGDFLKNGEEWDGS
jgi:hypothetical protein